MEERMNEKINQAHFLFDKFVQATTCKGTLKSFQDLCDYLDLKPKDHRSFYHKLKSKLNYWKAKALWSKLDKRGCHKDYKKGKACSSTKCLIIGAGPCGLRTAIDLCLLGAKVVIVEKRDAFSRNNVLHLWPFTITDLRGLGAKKFYGKFCAGTIDHISIRQLQLILLKVALILGIEIHVNVEFQGLIEPPEDQENERTGWKAQFHPTPHPVSEYEFDVVIGADGRRNTLEGFRRKEFRGRLAIAITVNFINRNTAAEAKVEEISGVAFIFNQKFFQDLREATGIDLENIVYYKDDTHYFVMTAKKQSLLEKGVILHDYADIELLLSRKNVDQEALLSYAREAADFSTNQQLPSLDFAINHYGQPDVAMFDFTCMYASENAALVRERNGHRLLVALVGDSLLEPFWPMGTGIARGFLAAMDSAWMVRSWAQGTSPLEVLAERESVYRLLPQTTPENVNKNFSQYSIDPTTRYPNVSLHLRPNQVLHLYNTRESKDLQVEMQNLVNSRTPKLARNESVARSSKLLSWCQRQTDGYRGVNVVDLTMSWKSGLALCAIIHQYRPDLIDFDSLDEHNVEKNNQLAFDIAEKEFGISPIMTGKEMASVGEPDKLSMVMYLTQFYEMFKDTTFSGENTSLNVDEKAALIASTKSPISFLSKLGQTISRKRTPKDKKEKDLEGSGKRRKTSQSEDEEVPRGYREERPMLVSALTERKIDAAVGNQNRVKSMATQLLAKFEENAPPQNVGFRRQSSFRKEFPQNVGGSDVCYFCQKRVYVMERLSAEGKFFHRSCFKCDYCGTTLRLSSYAYDLEDGKFYCKPHYCYRLSGYAHRKRPAAAPLSGKENKSPLKDTMAAEETGQTNSIATSAERTPGSSINGVEEPSLAKRLRGTPERIELENYRVSLQQEEELEEVPEETLAEHNLSNVLDKGTEEDAGSSSSESEMEEEEEGQIQPPSSDLGGVPWKEAVRIHALLRGKTEEDAEHHQAGEGEEEEDNEEEEDEEDDDEESSKAGNLRLQQIIHPVDPLEIQTDAHWAHIREKEEVEEEERVSTTRSSSSTAACEDNEADDEVGTGPAEAEDETGDDGDTCADLTDDDIPSDAEAEEQLHHLEIQEQDLKLNDDELAAADHVEENGPSKISSPVHLPAEITVPVCPVHSPSAQQTEITNDILLALKQKSPQERFFPDLVLLQEEPDDRVSADEKIKSPPVPVSPVHFQPLALPEATMPKSPVHSQQATPSADSCPLTVQLPICSQPLPSTEASVPTATTSPVCLQPIPTMTSTPLLKLTMRGQDSEMEKLTSPLAEEALKRNDLIEEFWMKSAEIRRSLGLTPLDRTKALEMNFSVASPEPASLSSYTTKDVLKEYKVSRVGPQPAPRKLNTPKLESEHLSLLTPKSPSEKELRSSDGEKKDLSSSSGLGLKGSSSNIRTIASESFNTSDSTMFTPPSSPPPPPPQNEEPATLRRKMNQSSWQKELESKQVPALVQPPSTCDVSGTTKEPIKEPKQEVRKSFIESVDEIPFADDVEDTYDDRTEDTSLHERFYTPPTSRPKPDKPSHLALAKENGELPSLEKVHQRKILPRISLEAKELAEERMRAREKSVKSQALRDAMAQQLCKMRELEATAAASESSKDLWKPSAKTSRHLKAKDSESPKLAVLRLSDVPTLKHETANERFSSPPAEGSVTSSEGSAGKNKKRTSLFSPRKNKKEKKSKNDSNWLSDKAGPISEEVTKRKSLWKSVFSGYKKDKKKQDDKSCPSTPSSSTTVDSGKNKISPVVKTTDLKICRHLSFSEDSDLSSDDVLEHSSQKSKQELIYVPHALAFKRSYSSKKAYTEEELNAKLTRRVQKAARRQAKQDELKRLHRAQIIQRQLEQVEEKQRKLEERGVAVEKALRGEADYWGESYYSDLIDLHLGVESNAGTPRRRPISFCPCCTHEGMGKKDDPKLMQEWFKLVQEKNALVRYESELMIFARELELEDRQSRLQQELRERMAVEDHLKTEEELAEEKRILNEMLEVVEQRDALVALLEEQRLREKEEDKDLEAVMLSKGFNLNWS
ncbi:F-actin-monooxygenase MICAL3 isoform X16 [Rhinatrema bivittatum]|uniref:F-actin-monooxygenase MICAL3 isoform X16 n=1 Tax=Rhinatrema bivittatum TaxID=194408 RepID=UPI00112AC549|nr:F-actin-monooxygenase MICAL3 isoform X16 [Rhinatrema bivittatum]